MKPVDIYEILNKAYFGENVDENLVIKNLDKILLPNNYFIDAGASLGQFTLRAAQIISNSNGKIASFEPDPIRNLKLVENCHDWSLKFNLRIDCEESALSNQHGSIIFHSTNSNVSGGLFKHDLNHLSEEHLKNVEWSEIEVPTTTLDSYVGDECPDLVKMDIEGAELRVLQGAKEILSFAKTTFLIELHDWYDPNGQSGIGDVISFFDQYDYVEEKFFGKSLFRHKNRDFSF